jgi:hypothetical protein
MRWLGVHSQNINGYNGSIADVFVAFQSLSALNYFYRYTSMTTPLGRNYVQGIPIPNFDPVIGEQFVDNCERNYQNYKLKFTTNEKN